MPQSESGSHFGERDFRVQNKIFAGLTRAGDRAWLKIASQLQVELIATRPEVFEAATGAWGRSGWTYVALPPLALRELRRLVEDSWRSIAPQAVPSAAATAKVAGQTAPGKVAPSKVAPGKVAPGKVAPGKVAPGKVAPSKVAPSKVAPSKVASAKSARRRAAIGTAATAGTSANSATNGSNARKPRRQRARRT